MLSILCALCLVVAMLPPVTASAAAPTTLTVGGTNVLSGGCWTTDGSGKLTATDSTTNYNVKYDSATGTLTLKDATINGTNTIYHVGAGIFASGDLTIVLEGSSTVKGVQDPNGETQSIRVEGNLTIQGGGSLTAQGAETSSGSSYGIFVFGSFTQQSGSVTASGGNVNGNYDSTGLYVSDGTVTAQGGTLTATGGNAGSGSYGISMLSSVTVNDAIVTATGGTGNYSYGLHIQSSSPSVTISGSGSLTARSGSATSEAGGIYVLNLRGSAGSVTVGDNSTLLANSVILYDNSFEAKPLAPTGDGSWLIYGQSNQTSAVGGTYTLEENITIPSGAVVTIPAGSTLTVPQGKTLTVDGTLNIANQSSLTGSGSLAGSGTFNLTNPEPVISGSDTLTYDGTDQSGKFTLTAPSGTVTVMGQSFTISSSPSLESWSLNQQEVKNAGTYTLTASNGTTTIEKEITVSPATISITSATVQDKTYDGNQDATVTGVEFTGLVTGESLSLGTDYTATATFADKNVGDSKSATVTVALSDTVKNYTLASDDTTANGTISPLPVVLEWETTSFTYDGTEHSVTAEVSNAVDGDNFNLAYTGNTGTAVNSYTATVTGLGNDNYTLTEATGVTQVWSIGVASIADATVELSETEFTYTGQSQKPTVTVKLGDKTLTADDYDVTYSGESINAGNYTVTVTGKGNYSGTASSKPTYTIKPVTVTPSIDTTATITKVYDGTTAAPAGLTITLEGVLSGDTVTATASFAYDSADAGESKTVTASNITLSGEDAGNYTLSSDTATANGTITPAALTVTADAKSKAYGDADPALTYQVSGLLNGDTLTGALERDAGENVGSYAITQGSLDAGDNYTLTFTGANLTITARPVTLSWSTPTSFTYDGSEHSVTAQVSNAVNGDTFTLTYENNAKTDVGNYTAKVTGLGNTNYTLTGASGTTQAWSIGVASIAEATVELSETEFTYTGQSQKPTVTVKLGNQTLTESDYTVTYDGDTTNAGTVKVTVTGMGNYADTASSQPTYTIQAATPTLTWEPASQTLIYTGLQAAITAPTVALVNSETYTGGFTYQYKAEGDESYTDGLPTDAGSYTVKASVEAQGNYTAATSGEMTLTIQKADAVVDSAPSAVDGLTYTGKAQALVTAGKATGGTMQYSLSETGTYSTDIPTSTNVGSYTVWYKVVGDENHNDTTAQSVTATIAKAAAKVTKAPAANTLTYNGEAQALATAGEANGGTLVYSLEKDGDYDAAIPTGTNAGSYSIWYKVVGDANHSDTDPVQVEVTIKKADPDVTAPDGLTATYGDTLSDVALSGGWSWDTPDASVGNVGGNTFSAIYTPSDTTNYNTVNEDLTVTVSAKDITGAEITLGDSLTYTGQEQTQQITGVTVGGIDVTCTVTGNTGTDAGDYTLTVTGTGNFTGTATKGWSIAKANYTGTTGVSSTVLANWLGEVELPTIPDGASYGTPTGSDVTGLTITGNVLSYTGGSGIVKDQTYTVTVPVTGATNYADYNITVTLTGTDKTRLEITGVTAQNGTYNGQTQAGYTGTPSAQGYTGDFTVTYNTTDGKAPTNAGTYTVTLAIPDSIPQYAGSVDLEFTIAQKPLTVSAADVSVYTGSAAPQLALTYDGLVDGERVTPSEAPAFTITKADGTEIALANAVKTAGTYTITWSNAAQGFTDAANYAITVETGTLRVSNRPVPTNPGNTETVTKPDGTTVTTETKPDGTVTTTTTDKTGNKTQVVEKPDGSSSTTVTNKDGSSSTTQVDKTGQVEAEVKLPAQVVEAAAEAGEAVTLPMPEVPVTTDWETAPTVTVDLPSNAAVQVEIPVADVTPGTVAVLVKTDGTEEVIKTSVTTDSGVAVTLNDGDTVKIVDNATTFTDVSEDYWGADAVAFATSRELFAGTSATTFAPDTAMTRAMIVTVLARFEGVDTTTGSTWYEAGQQWAVANGVSDGTNMDQGLSREQLATMLWRYAGSPSVSNSLSGYTDAGTVSSYAQQAMAWCVEQGIIGGTTTTTLSPQGPATRAQVATILMRFIEGMA